MNENEAHIILTKMKFTYNPEKGLFYKNIVPGYWYKGRCKHIDAVLKVKHAVEK